MGLLKLGVVALDETKLKANASKHKAMSLARRKQEQERLELRHTQSRLARIRAAQELLAEAAA